jgi:ribosomal protein S18 acetylase RimI-like enzyme
LPPEPGRILKPTRIAAEVVIRLCRAEDLEALEWFGQFRHHRQIFADAFARHERGENIMLVADLAGFPVGQAWVDLTKRRAESIGYIWAVRVFGFLRNLGIGTQLVQCAEELLAQRGYATAELGVEKTNPRARQLYERLGYAVVDEKASEYSYVTPDGVEARHIVDHWVLQKRLPAVDVGAADDNGDAS